jgi:uncharacterized repeat protein (TIGR02543 family)
MDKKRILSILLAAVLLFTMDAGSLYAMELPQGSRQYGEESQEGNETGDETEDDDETKVDNETDDEIKDDDETKEDEENWRTVYFELDGGTTAEGEKRFTMEVKDGETVDAAAVLDVEKRGYLFQGWLDSEGNYYVFDAPVTEDITLSASWTPITYRIQFDLNGGEGKPPAGQIVAYDEKLTLPRSECHRKDYVLIGWEQEGVGIYQENSIVMNLADAEGAVVVLKAVWRRGQYKVRFHANGGSGKMEDEAFSCGKSKKLTKNKFTRSGYSFAGWNTRKDGKGVSYKQQQSVSFANQKDGSTVTLYAMWKGNSYKVNYNSNGGKSGKVSSSKHVYGSPSKLRANSFKRKGYKFVGWNTQKNGKGKTYKSGAKVSKLTTKAGGTVTLYARWQAVSYKIKYDTKKGKLPKKAKKSYKITSKTFDLPIPTRKGYDFDGWYKDKKCRKRVGYLKKGNTGNKKYYAKWVKCTRKPSKKYAKITLCKATATGKIKFKATVKKRVASSDDRYYLVYVNPLNGKPYKMAKRAYKKKKLSFTLKTSENQGYALAMFGVAVKKKGKYYLVSEPSYVKNPEKAARNKSKYKLGKTKKGMQFYNNTMDEIVDCNARNTFLNLTLSSVYTNPAVAYKYNGKTYYFSAMDSYRQLVSECNKKGINVTVQILLDWVEGQTNLIDSRARIGGAAPYYTWNVRSNGAREKMEAVFSYLGKVFGTKKCYVSNWVLGNEINNPRNWNYAGAMSENSYFTVYAYAFRSLYYAVRSQYSNAHVFICMDNLWNTSVAGGYSVKHSISSFVSHLKRVQKGLKWNLAYHAYSAPLTYTNFWDGYGITGDENSPYITMKNLNVLTDYIKRHYGSSVRVILSEQGYSSNWGQANQAAAIAASYYIAACNPMVDAFIIRSYQDHPVEVAQGLPMGIKGKEAFEVFRHMDTAATFQYTDRYLGLIRITAWNQLVPGFSARRLYTMYRR